MYVAGNILCTLFVELLGDTLLTLYAFSRDNLLTSSRHVHCMNSNKEYHDHPGHS